MIMFIFAIDLKRLDDNIINSVQLKLEHSLSLTLYEENPTFSWVIKFHGHVIFLLTVETDVEEKFNNILFDNLAV